MKYDSNNLDVEFFSGILEISIGFIGLDKQWSTPYLSKKAWYFKISGFWLEITQNQYFLCSKTLFLGLKNRFSNAEKIVLLWITLNWAAWKNMTWVMYRTYQVVQNFFRILPLYPNRTVDSQSLTGWVCIRTLFRVPKESKLDSKLWIICSINVKVKNSINSFL